MTYLYTLFGLTLSLAAMIPHARAQKIEEQLLPPIETRPVQFEKEVKESIGPFTNIANATFKPPGAGPFPAVVLMHTCGGVRKPHIKEHAGTLLAAGYVVLVVDSFEPRGFPNCSVRLLSVSAGIADAYAALDSLASQPFVDRTRIYQIGYSWGGIVATLLASPQSASLAGTSARFTATVSHYSNCIYRDKQHFVLRDIDRPLLMLMGERDDELPPGSCFPLLDELKANGQPVDWHVFPGTTHGWDQKGQGSRGYAFDEGTTRDAAAKSLEFFSRSH